MKFYYSSESAPLKFHKAFYKVISPILIVCHTILLLATIGHIINDDGHYDLTLLILDLVICSMSIVFLGYITYGFANKKEYAWHLVYAYLGTTVLTRIIAAAMADNAAVAVGQIIGSFIIPILIGVYYYKRKPLFVASEVEYQNGTTNYAVQSQACGSVQDSNNKVEINYCSACGSKLVKDSAFCHKCGYKIKRDWTTQK